MELSFAKTMSGAMSLRCNAFITVMKATHLRDCDNPSCARHLPREGTLLVEPQMGSGLMVVTEIRSQGSLQMPRVQNDEMVQAVSSYRADQALNIRIGEGCQLHSIVMLPIHLSRSLTLFIRCEVRSFNW